MKTYALIATVADQPGMLFQLTKVFVEHQVNITHVDLHTVDGVSEIYFELTGGEVGSVGSWTICGVYPAFSGSRRRRRWRACTASGSS